MPERSLASLFLKITVPLGRLDLFAPSATASRNTRPKFPSLELSASINFTPKIQPFKPKSLFIIKHMVIPLFHDKKIHNATTLSGSPFSKDGKEAPATRKVSLPDNRDEAVSI